MDGVGRLRKPTGTADDEDDHVVVKHAVLFLTLRLRVHPALIRKRRKMSFLNSPPPHILFWLSPFDLPDVAVLKLVAHPNVRVYVFQAYAHPERWGRLGHRGTRGSHVSIYEKGGRKDV